jgi:hypothetical protein
MGQTDGTHGALLRGVDIRGLDRLRFERERFPALAMARWELETLQFEWEQLWLAEEKAGCPAAWRMKLTRVVALASLRVSCHRASSFSDA